MKNVNSLPPFKRLCVTIGNLPSSYVDSMSYYECLMWLCKYLKETVIPAINENAEAVKEIQDWIKNLDLQDEVDNKLDEMSESGELQEIISAYLNSQAIFGYDTVSNMVSATNLINGSTARTLGFNSKNDGGGATYKIRNITNDDVVDGASIIEMQTSDDLIAELIQEPVMNVKQFGATESNSIDQSSYIQLAINYCLDKNVETLLLNGSYFINTKLEIDTKANLVIKNGTLYVHETNDLLSNGFNVLYIKGSTNINIDNIKIIELNPVTRSRELRVGGILYDNSNNCSITNCYIENTASGIMLYNGCKNCTVSDNTIYVNYQSSQFSQSAILNFASDNNTIKNNDIYGEYYDGSLSIYGNSNDIIVDGNKLHNKIGSTEPSYLSQGITIDSGVNDCICTNNMVYDYWYGIDNKSDVKNSLIKGNTLVGCKISITDRTGENTQASATFNTTIIDNKIIIKKDYKTSDSTRSDGSDYLHLDKYYYVGISCGNRQTIKIKNNDITVFGTLTDTLLGIYASQSSSSNQYLGNIQINENSIELSSGHGSTTSNAVTNSSCIALNGIKKGTITDNVFKTDTTGNTYHIIELYGDNEDLLITNNNARCTNYSNHLFITEENSGTIINSKIIDNLLINCSFINNLGSITNIVEQNRWQFVARRIKAKQLSNNTWATVCKFRLPYDGSIQLKLKGLMEASGLRVLDSMYNVTVSGTTVTGTSVYDNNINIDVQFVNEGTSKEISLQVKMNRDYNIQDIFITDLISSQEAIVLSD